MELERVLDLLNIKVKKISFILRNQNWESKKDLKVFFVVLFNFINFVFHVTRRACHSFIGRVRGEQNVYIDDDCVSLRNVKHELMHAIGFAHEQSRMDRDDHIILHEDNIIDGI